MAGFWAWATTHWLLTFFIANSVLWTIREIVKNVTAIFTRVPEAPEVEETPDEAEPVEITPAPPLVAEKPSRPSRSIWARIMHD